MDLPSMKARRDSRQARKAEVTDRIRTMWFCLSGVITRGHVGVATPGGDERLGDGMRRTASAREHGKDIPSRSCLRGQSRSFRKLGVCWETKLQKPGGFYTTWEDHARSVKTTGQAAAPKALHRKSFADLSRSELPRADAID